MNSKKITKCVRPQTSIREIINTDISMETPIVMFNYFHGESIEINGFNNYYVNSQKSMVTACSFIDRIKDIQSKTVNELTNGSNKKQFHFHPIEGKREIDRVNNILLIGYKFSSFLVENFENNYYEFSLVNGKRVIFVKVDNKLYLLFIDSNHFIYKESSKYTKLKEIFTFPCCLGKINFENDYLENDLYTAIHLLLDAHHRGEIDNLDEFAGYLEEFSNQYSVDDILLRL